MIKLQIGENTVSLTKEEQDFLFRLLDEKYDQIQNIPTFNAIRNWMYAEGCRPSVAKVENKEDVDAEKRLKEITEYFTKAAEKVDKMIEDPWNEKQLENIFDSHQPQDEVRYKNLRDILIKLLSKNENGYYIAC